MPTQLLRLSPIALLAIQALEPDCDLKFGDYGSDIQRLQTVLREMDFYQGELNGYFCSKTQQALMQLQREVDVETTGRFDVSTWYNLTYWAEDLVPEPVATVAYIDLGGYGDSYKLSITPTNSFWS